MDKLNDDFSDVMIPYVEFAENANERTPCILVLDCSGSMRGEPIKQLNTGLQALEKELKDDIDASSRVQLLVIKAYGKDDADVSADWVDAMNFNAPVMEASGLSPIGKAMELALQKIEEQKCLYDSCGVTSKRPWIFLISDGEPTDYGWELAAEKCRIAQQNKKVVVHAVGTQGANLEKLAKFSIMAPKRLSGLKFTEFFLWLSRSVSCISRAAPNMPDILDDIEGWHEENS
ncbi:MAG: VWA domain-containing protein [Alphaproteobacteria bacterium]|nr:VWA domain-containing protein [Alphaproteobacteria bacterium]